MKLLDAKPGQKMRRSTCDVCWWDEAGVLKTSHGRVEAVLRDWFDFDDWQPVETDAEKIARLEVELAHAKGTLGRIFAMVDACRLMPDRKDGRHCHCCGGSWLQSHAAFTQEREETGST